MSPIDPRFQPKRGSTDPRFTPPLRSGDPGGPLAGIDIPIPQLQDELISGLAFPFSFANGRVKMSSGVRHLRDDMHAIIMTGEREYPMLSDFGCSIHGRLFDPVNLMPLATRDILTAIRRWEKRVKIDSVQARYAPEADGVVDIGIQFSVVGTDETGDLVLRQGG